MKRFHTLHDIRNLQGQRVLLRLDLNVPLQGGRITDTMRIDRIRPTLQALTEKKAKVIVMTHLGRPEGKVDPRLSTKLLADHLGVAFSNAPPGPEMDQAIEELPNGGILLLENLRFYPGEETNDSGLARAFAQSADLYINDAFSVSHRAHMSVEAITHYLPSYAGPTLNKELRVLSEALETPDRPLTAIVGGAKVSSKLEILENLSKKVDQLIIGGAMANTFLMAQGYDMGSSLVETDLCETALRILQKATSKVILPVDAVVAPEISSTAVIAVKDVGKLSPEDMVLDIGPQTALLIEESLKEAKTVVINGPLGVFETSPFDKGTNQVFSRVGQLTKSKDLRSIAGGGDTFASLAHAGIVGDISYVSTAGGAFFEWLEGRKLPGVEALYRC